MSAAVSVLVLALILIAVLVLAAVLIVVLILISVLILVIHNSLPPVWYLRLGRYSSLSTFSGFILGLKNQAGGKSCQYGGSDTSGGGFQATGEDAQKALLVHSFLHALGQRMSKARQGNCGAGTAPVGNGLIQPQGA